MGLFGQFPFTNFHELNLDWIIQELKKRGENMVLSVNGETGDVVLYKDENVVFPEVNSGTWRMVRVADGHTAGVMFQNGLMYVMFDNAAERVYTVDHPPTYPVTSVDGQTGAVRVFPDAATRLPDVTADKTNIRRQIRAGGVDHIVGIEIDKDKATRMDDNHRYKIYDEGNTPDIVTSINGDSGAVIIAIPFEDTETANILFADAASGHEWSLGRETADGVASIQLETDSSSAAAYLRFYTEDDPPVSFVKKLLTVDDIPSSSGVVSFNGQTGVVTAYGDTIPVESGAARSMKEYTDDVSSGLGYVELTNTATHNIPFGAYVVWKGILYTASSIIAIGDTLSGSNLTAVSGGGMNDLASDLASLETNINNRFTVIDSGSIYDLYMPGIYYLTANVTNKPIAGGGVYIIGSYSTDNTTIAGIFVSEYTNEVYQVRKTLNDTYVNQLSVQTTQVSATTSATGAVSIPSDVVNKRFLNAKLITGGPGYVVRRDDSFFTVFDNYGNPLISTVVVFDAYFV